MEPFDFIEAEEELGTVGIAFMVGMACGAALTALCAWAIW